MEDRPGLFDDTTVLSDTQSDELVAYRPVSTLAVFAAMLALVAGLALVSPWAAWLPAIAVLFCFMAVWSTDANRDTQSGGGLARVGLVVSLVLGAAVFARSQYRQQAHAAAARPVAERFLERLSEGDAIGAFELTLPVARRRPSKATADAYYRADEVAAKRLADFRSSEEVERFLGSGDALTLVRALPAQPDRGKRLTIAWELEVSGTEGTKPRRLTLTLHRRAESSVDTPADWRIGQLRTVAVSG